MRIVWIANSKEDLNWFLPFPQGWKVSVTNFRNGTRSIADCDALIVDADYEFDGSCFRSSLDWLTRTILTTDFLTPILIHSYRKIELLRDKNPIIDSKAAKFFRLPGSRTDFLRAVELLQNEPLTTGDLHEIRRWKCGLQNEWSRSLHLIGNVLGETNLDFSKIKHELVGMAESIERFAIDQFEQLGLVLQLSRKLDEHSNLNDIRMALDKLGHGLRYPPKGESLSDQVPLNLQHLPHSPPKGFCKVLIADDHPANYLADSLRREFGYKVISPQATKFRTAVKLLKEQSPDVVLADLYFKESDRESEAPDKEVGYRFINHALRSRNESDHPLVLVTSKALLRTDTEVPVGAINCSGALRATDPAAIHAEIWNAAGKLGIAEPVPTNGGSSQVEKEITKRLEFVRTDLTFLTDQWSEFGKLITDTLSLCVLLKKQSLNSNRNDELVLNSLIEVLRKYDAVEGYSINLVKKVFVETTAVHLLAKDDPPSEIKTAVRNILHGKIEQFSSIVNGVKSAVTVTQQASEGLASYKVESLGEVSLESVLSVFSDEAPLEPQLESLVTEIDKILAKLPKAKTKASLLGIVSHNRQIIDLVVIEDTLYWSKYVLRVARELTEQMSSSHIIRCRRYDNTAEALASIPLRKNTHALIGTIEESRTIVVADICLPKNKKEADVIHNISRSRLNTFTSPDRKNGFELISTLTGYNYNVPMIVFSTIDSIQDRRMICGWGVPEENFISKRHGAEREMKRALLRLFDRSEKYLVKRLYDDETELTTAKYWINGVKIPFSEELEKTFTALYDLASLSERQIITTEQIIGARDWANGVGSKKKVQEHIFEIRRSIFETLRRNHIYINPHEFLKTTSGLGEDRFSYRLNADLADEEDVEIDLSNLAYNNRVLVMETGSQQLGNFVHSLEDAGYVVETASDLSEVLSKAQSFEPDILVIGLDDPIEAIDCWKQTKNLLSHKDLGVILCSVAGFGSEAVSSAVETGIPLANMIDERTEGWNLALVHRLAREQRRIFFGEAPEKSDHSPIPVIRILSANDFATGRLSFSVNDKPFTCRSSQLSRILGVLVSNPHRLVSFSEIKSATVGGMDVTADDKRNWTKRMREIIADHWLEDEDPSERAKRSKTILERMSDGFALNIHLLRKD